VSNISGNFPVGEALELVMDGNPLAERFVDWLTEGIDKM
jgi:hypothetical protein